eukprot:CAMPEP_0170157736 /NCGR_PEP_ID=MMETSP0033_2-20121228/66600_1 /TAXON_ID=195969 /ORGANISM="Dolichomastix tenuilepis, Strain CCMP3274" /LENGTH=78 /DNA_ID=CAMNT_0010395141 /DNA_START=53 /DNA_END=286 /DNA_ORIENTATION=+
MTSTNTGDAPAREFTTGEYGASELKMLLFSPEEHAKLQRSQPPLPPLLFFEKQKGEVVASGPNAWFRAFTRGQASVEC